MHNNLIKPSIDSFVKALNNGKISVKHIFKELSQHNIDFYWHPLGFILATYLQEDNKKIRIHLWPKKGSQVQKPNYCIHNHIFNLKSWIIEGEIENTEYSFTETAYSPTCIYSVQYKNNLSSLIKTQQYIEIKRIKNQKYSKGSTYSINNETIHSSKRTSTSSALTILLSMDHPNPKLIVVGDTSGKEKYTYKRNKVDPKYIKLLIDELSTM